MDSGKIEPAEGSGGNAGHQASPAQIFRRPSELRGQAFEIPAENSFQQGMKVEKDTAVFTIVSSISAMTASIERTSSRA
jgi:hypothetical protein